MSSPSLESLLSFFGRHPSLTNAPAYTKMWMVPGGHRDFHAGLSFFTALDGLEEVGPIHSFDDLLGINKGVTYFEQPLETLNPEWPTGDFRDKDEVYFYPNCPKGYPLSKLHHLVFEGNAETIKKMDELYETHGTWYNMLEAGVLSTEEKTALFRQVSSKTHGTREQFGLSWIRLQRECTETSTNPDTGLVEIKMKVDPVIYALKAHDCIIQHMPFIRGNRRTARLLMIHTLLKSGVYPPIFWSGPSYETKITKHRWCDLEAIKNETDPTKKKILQENRIIEFKDFVAYILSLSIEVELRIGVRADPERPFEAWEMSCVNSDLKTGILQYVESRKRVLVPDLISAVSVFLVDGPRGKDSLDASQVEPPEERKNASWKTWYWGDLNNQLREALSSLLQEKKIILSHAEKTEFMSRGIKPPFNGDHSPETWKAVALRVAETA